MSIKISSLIVGLATVVLTTVSCKKEYLETVPTTAVAASSVLESVANATAALNGIHRSMYMRYNDQGTFGFGSVMIYNDCMGEDFVFSGQ